MGALWLGREQSLRVDGTFIMQNIPVWLIGMGELARRCDLPIRLSTQALVCSFARPCSVCREVIESRKSSLNVSTTPTQHLRDERRQTIKSYKDIKGRDDDASRIFFDSLTIRLPHRLMFNENASWRDSSRSLHFNNDAQTICHDIELECAMMKQKQQHISLTFFVSSCMIYSMAEHRLASFPIPSTSFPIYVEIHFRRQHIFLSLL